MNDPWDGADRQIITRVLLGMCFVGLLVDHFTKTDGSDLFGLVMLFFAIGIGLVPPDGRKPRD